ncbi:MAG: type II toxin-antitoxin system HicA family toxin [Planctomycetes bacterium]|nr:type II toxin-antitoxin system HicA family toxin [Planctomycetota bacterium]
MKAREVIRVLLRNGFAERKAKGGHRQFVRAEPPPKRLVTVAYHTSDIPKPTLRKIAVQSGKDLSEFE